ncbi:MAG: DUF2628 domain-containing protein [Hyphomicrobiales bacterium]|nr:DUF2628 domain-containing protein [Hyphomicrobiales bacterium]MDE2114144.1 DUF2628 domain-containing protein [Hyphomicrobiales bacterium]
MSIFTVHVPPGNQPDAADNTLFVRDGFYWSAALFTPLWLIFRRLWLELAIYMLATTLLAVAARHFALPIGYSLLAAALLQVYVGIEASSLLQGRLLRRGFEFAGVVAGKHQDEVERRYFSQASSPISMENPR